MKKKLVSLLTSRSWNRPDLALIRVTIFLSTILILAVTTLSVSTKNSIENNKYKLIGGNIVIQSNNKINPSFDIKAKALGIETAESINTLTMIRTDQKYLLTSLKAISSTYPLYGQLKTEPKLERRTPQKGAAWIDRSILNSLKIKLGDSIQIGSKKFKVTAVIESDPLVSFSFIQFSPQVIINNNDILQTKILLPGSRASYKIYLKSNAEKIKHFTSWYKKNNLQNTSLKTAETNQNLVDSITDSAMSFISLCIITCLILSAICIAISTHGYLKNNTQQLGIIRCLGGKRSTVLHYFSYQFSVNFLFSTALAIIITNLFFMLINSKTLFSSPIHLQLFSYSSIAKAITCNAIMLTTFCLPAILRYTLTEPQKLIKKSQLKAFHPTLDAITSTLSISIISWLITSNLQLTMKFVFIFTLFLSIVTITIRIISKLLHAIIQPNTPFLKLALIKINREQFRITLQLIAFISTLSLIFFLIMLQHQIKNDFTRKVNSKSPNHFIINVAPNQKKNLQNIFLKNNIKSNTLYANVRARLSSINGQSIFDIQKRKPINHNVLRRTINITYSSSLPDGNQLTKGKWWNKDTEKNFVSVEQEVARTLGIRIGNNLTFTSGSKKITARVINIRSVNWQSLSPNYYFILTRHAMKNLAFNYITSFHLPITNDNVVLKISNALPNTSIISIRSIISKTLDISKQLIFILSMLTLIACFIGLLIINSIFQYDFEKRKTNSLILKKLGCTQPARNKLLRYEYIAMSVIAGILILFSANLLYFLTCHYLLSIDFHFSLTLSAFSFFLSPIIIYITSILLSKRL